LHKISHTRMLNHVAPLGSIAASVARFPVLALRNRETVARFVRMSRRPIIIGGCGRSGTSLLLSVLSCHPAVCAIPYETRALCPAGYSRFPDIDFGIRWDRLFQGVLDAGLTHDMSRWCEKTPRNVRAFPHLLRRFGPEARFIHLVRDGRDVVLSRHPRDRSQYYVSPKRWVDDVRAGLAVQADPRVVLIRYEDLVQDVPGTMEHLCAALSLDFSPSTFDYPSRAAVQRHPAWTGAAKPVSASSVGKWRASGNAGRVDKFLETPSAADLLMELGYGSSAMTTQTRTR
jgi:hypothetical protein